MRVIEAAKQLGVTPRRIRAMCEARRLKAYKSGRDWSIDAKSVEAVKARKARKAERSDGGKQ